MFYFMRQAALLRKSLFRLTVPFPVALQRDSLDLDPIEGREAVQFMIAMLIWISAVWRSGSREMIRRPKSFRRFIRASTRLRTW
jgi:hypothetical protein